jgi:predicted hydrocarbon binding protein
MNVKAQGLLNAAKYIEERYGREALGEVVRACSDATRDTFTSSIAINWHPVEELCEFVEVAEAKLGEGRGKLAQEVGAAGARANMKGLLLRLAFYWGKPEFLMKRAAALWRQFNDEGSMELTQFSERLVSFEVKGVVTPRATFCQIITGWCQETAVALGVKSVVAHHTECRARGGKRCLFEVRGYVAPGSVPNIPAAPR